MKVVVFDIVNKSIVAFHEEGLLVFPYLDNAIKHKETVEVSFDGIEQCTTQFLHSAIGKLYLNYPVDTVDQLLVIDYDTLPNLKTKIDKVRWSALNAEKYGQIVSEATSIS